MCVIAASRAGVPQPTIRQLETCFRHNPHGAGYMYARDGKVTIHKGFMTWKDFYNAVTQEQFTAADPVVYHFRIATQAGINPEMTHPFPLTPKLEHTTRLDLTCPVGIAHNGIIRMTSCPGSHYSDTALFITEYMTKLIRKRADVSDEDILTMIDLLTNSKWAIMTGAGDIETVGRFIHEPNGLIFSNGTYL